MPTVRRYLYALLPTISRYVYALLFVLFLGESALTQQKTPGTQQEASRTQQKVPRDLFGSYFFQFEWGATRIVLKPHGKFIRESSNCTSVFKETGRYTFADGVLHFTITKITTRGHDEDAKEIDLRKRKARKEILDTDEPFERSDDELRVIRWGERIYLMEANQFEAFIDGINLGFEPRRVDGYRPLYGFILLREGDELKDASGQPSLPAQFLSMLLPEPVTATVVRVEKIDNETIATLDRGKRDGFRKGMTLISESTSDSWYPDRRWVVSVDETTSRVKAPVDVKVGDKFTTRIRDVRRYAGVLQITPHSVFFEV